MPNSIRRVARHVLRAILIAFAVLYFLIDLIFLSILRPLRRRLMALRLMQRLRRWVGTLNRYTALLLLLVPWLILEPIKPIGVMLFVHHHRFSATLLIGLGEIVKVTLFEQLFDMAKPQLMSFTWFAWGYGKWRAAIEYVQSLPIWQWLLGRYRAVRGWALRHFRFVRIR